MYLDQISAAPPDTALIARTGLAASHWEVVLAAGQVAEGARAWLRPPLTTLPAWLHERWDSARHPETAPGIVTGTIKVVQSPADVRVLSGEIVVLSAVEPEPDVPFPRCRVEEDARQGDDAGQPREWPAQARIRV